MLHIKKHTAMATGHAAGLRHVLTRFRRPPSRTAGTDAIIPLAPLTGNLALYEV